jgi:hypothetical protein
MLSLALGINLGGAAVGLYRPSLSPELRADASADVIGYSQLTVAPCLVNGFPPRVGRRW